MLDVITIAARHDLVKGFAVGRTIFGDTARDWMQGAVEDDKVVVATMAARYRDLCALWDGAWNRARVKGTT